MAFPFRKQRQELLPAPAAQALSLVTADRHHVAASRAVSIQNSSVVTGLSFSDFQQLFVYGTHSGVDVNAENASRAIPVQACCTLIAGGIMSMPLRIVQREIIDGQASLKPADDHPYWWLFNEQPNEESTSAHFLEHIVKRKILWGRSFARIIRKSGGRSIEIAELVWYPNECVQVEKKWDDVAKRWRIFRYLFRDGMASFGVPPEDVLDFRGAQAPHDQTMSEELWSAREAVGLCLTIEEYCGRFFSNGGMPRTIVEYPNKVDKEQQELLRDAWIRKYGGAENAAIPLILTQGGKTSKLQWNAEEAQMLEARKFQVIEIARGLGVPPFMIGETEKSTAWGTGLESMGLGFIRYTLGRHITAIEQEINRKIFRISKYFVDFDEEALARGDMASLGTWFRQAVGGSNGPGFMTTDEVRARLKMGPAPDGSGKTLYVPTAKTDPNKSSGDENAAQSPDGANGGEQKPPA